MDRRAPYLYPCRWAVNPVLPRSSPFRGGDGRRNPSRHSISSYVHSEHTHQGRCSRAPLRASGRSYRYGCERVIWRVVSGASARVFICILALESIRGDSGRLPFERHSSGGCWKGQRRSASKPDNALDRSLLLPFVQAAASPTLHFLLCVTGPLLLIFELGPKAPSRDAPLPPIPAHARTHTLMLLDPHSCQLPVLVSLLGLG